jgi:hypothetical protein
MFAFASCAMRPKMDCLTMVLPFVLLSCLTDSSEQMMYRFSPQPAPFSRRVVWNVPGAARAG